MGLCSTKFSLAWANKCQRGEGYSGAFNSIDAGLKGTIPMAFLDSNPTTIAPSVEPDDRLTQLQLRVRIPKHYANDPIISCLVAQYGLTVNITAALLSMGDRDDGWFELNVTGSHRQIRSALDYMNDLDLEIWPGGEDQIDGW